MIQFFGIVLPKEATVNIACDPRVRWPIPERNLEIDFSLRIHSSIVEVDCELSRVFVPDDLVHIYACALDLTKASVGLVAFAMGFALTVVLQEMKLPESEKTNILLGDPRLPILCDAFKVNTEKNDSSFNEVLLMVLLNPPLHMALDDLIESISYPHRSPVNCARAIERLRHLMSPGAKRGIGWAKLRESLQTDQKYLEFITSHSEGPRHGDPTYIPGDVCDEITFRAWILLNRYFEFKRRGGQPLPISQFPLLRG